MELHLALKQIINIEGTSVLNEQRLINILSDLQAYETIPASKYIISCMINEGYIRQLLCLNNWGIDGVKLLDQFVQTTGFNANYAEKIWLSFAFAMNWIDDLANYSNNTFVKLPSSESIMPHTLLAPLPESNDDNPHLCFRKIPITGNVELFIHQLITLGYVVTQPYSDEYNIALLSGSFAGITNCQIIVVGTPATRITCRVVVSLPSKQVWYNLKSEYEDYKQKLTKKYGRPESYEYFMDPYSEGDGYELTALFSEHCHYMSFFKEQQVINGTVADIGTIVLKLSTDARVSLTYEDTINSDKGENEKNAIADDDL